ncbi:hypothetical protein AAFF_G00367230 [Aldrovandia affinis]|uniref:Transmembrane protein 265 n=1 Tax=Aldrovandia affinis TaxID=143900 RepID=A0AAD7SHX0_9TELE|nr:hypothetical protein AAFF_G00367230 [Aldrovandia affinis]
MSSPSSAAALTGDDVVPLQSVPGSGQQSSSKNDSPKGHGRDYRKLAIGSIICGISCIGIFALINAVKAQERSPRDPERAQVYSHKAWRLSLIAIATWVVLLILIPVLMALVSYLLTLID